MADDCPVSPVSPLSPGRAWVNSTLNALGAKNDNPQTYAAASIDEPVSPTSPKAEPMSPGTAWISSTLHGLRNMKARRKFAPHYRGARLEFADERADRLEKEKNQLDVEDETRPPSVEPSNETGSEGRREEQLKELENKTQSFLPDVRKVLEHLKKTGDTFTESDRNKMLSAFQRFKDPMDPDIHKDELPTVLKFLGYSVDVDRVKEIANTIVEHTMLEKEEFETFMATYHDRELERYRDIFTKFDEDASGELDKEEIVDFISHLGFTPLRPMIREAFELVDLDGSGTLDFEEVVLLLHVYKHSEGFTLEEVQQFTSIFGGFDPNDVKNASFQVSPDRISELLVKFYGPSINKLAGELQAEAMAALEAANKEATMKQRVVSEGISFQEALLWARRVRDKMFQSYREAFDTFDEDGSNSIDRDELKRLLHKLGYTLPNKALNQLLTKAQDEGDMKKADDDGMDFDTFVNFMQLLNQTDGFTDTELAVIENAFNKHDDDGSGDMDVVELSVVLESMGCWLQMKEVRKLHAKIDYNGNGTLDKREFIAFMRLFRERELASVTTAFEEFQNEDEKIPSLSEEAALARVLELADHKEEDDESDEEDAEQQESMVPKIEVKDFLTGRDHDFDDFVELCGKVEEARAAISRKYAGYSDCEITKYRGIFDSFDKDKVGTLSPAQFMQVITTIGFEASSLEEQQELAAQIAAAREAAIEDKILDKDDAQMNFYVLLKVLRAMERKRTSESEADLKRLAQETRFSLHEINDFQDVFDTCYEKNSGFDDLDHQDGATRSLNLLMIMRLLRSMNMKLDMKQRSDLENKLGVLTDKRGRAEFFDFLRLMRWMMDTNFCNIQGVSASK